MNWSDTTADRWTDRLSDYLDGHLTAAEREELESHLFHCARCAQTLDELRGVVAHARTLVNRAPADDLWPGIQARLATRTAPAAGARTGEPAPAGPAREPSVVPLRPRGLSRRFSLSLPQLAAAAIALVIVSVASVWLLRSGPRAPAVASRSPDTTLVAGGDVAVPAAAVPDLRVANFADREYAAAVADLQRALEQGRVRLSPATVEVLERNLGIIDAAIEQARRALVADPGDIYLNDHLAETMRRKLDLLRRANAIATAQT